MGVSLCGKSDIIMGCWLLNGTAGLPVTQVHRLPAVGPLAPAQSDSLGRWCGPAGIRSVNESLFPLPRSLVPAQPCTVRRPPSRACRLALSALKMSSAEPYGVSEHRVSGVERRGREMGLSGAD